MVITFAKIHLHWEAPFLIARPRARKRYDVVAEPEERRRMALFVSFLRLYWSLDVYKWKKRDSRLSAAATAGEPSGRHLVQLEERRCIALFVSNPSAVVVVGCLQMGKAR